IFANATEIPRDAIEETIGRMVAARADRTVFVDAADDAKYGLAVRVMDAARGAGATTVGILTETGK
ncbi:MAG: biopolymer transporter ExbD, partial [Deltaproteobacteria bacterium]|nr:biopolymer transporter ExbD [Deltaproteobacteria bacterium]